eukprot:764150-Hanusia_phi.AAC.2
MEMRGPLLIDVDSGTYRNNWVRGVDPPAQENARTFDPRGDWKSGSYGTKGTVPGMEPDDLLKKSKKKKKKSQKADTTGFSSEEGEDAKEDDEHKKLDQVAREEGPKEYKSLDEVNKRIKAVTKKLKQAQQISSDIQKGVEVNQDQKKKSKLQTMST